MKRLLILTFTLAALAMPIAAQTNDFTYQGSLFVAGVPANGTYDFEFRLFGASSGGPEVGVMNPRPGVTVTDGRFTVSLAFIAGFPGDDRWLEISVRPSGSGGGFQPLLPRVKIGSSPYSIKSQSAEIAANATNATTANNALSLGGVSANQYIQTSDPRLTDARPPTPGSTNYIQNQNTGAQAASNFNISGNGTAGGTLTGNTLDATTQLNINGVRAFTINGLFSSPGFPLALSNTFAGVGAGVNTTPDPNTSLSQGKENSFFGVRAGIANVTGYSNSFFGSQSGESNTNGFLNSFFGLRAGESNTGGDNNSFFGALAGGGNTGGEGNTFLGRNAGFNNSNGNNNSALGYLSSVSSDLQYATAIGAEAVVTNSNSVVLGRPGGEDTVRIAGPTSLNGNLVVASGNIILFQSPVALTTLGTAGGSALCRNGSSQIALCSSSLRYKTEIRNFESGLRLIDRLRPITFNWIDGQPRDLGLGAEDVAAIEPLLVTYNEKGEVEGVKYDRIGVVLVNVVKEQQSQIEALKTQIEEQRAITESLRQLVCAQNPSAAVCSPK